MALSAPYTTSSAMRLPLLSATLLLATLTGALPQPIAATNRPSATRSTSVIRSWNTTDGLPQNTVITIVQSRDGYLWLGTWDGLVRFDGVRFTTYGLDEGLPSVHVTALLEDRDGTLWVATAGGGLGCWRAGRLENLDAALEGDVVNCLQEDATGKLWVGTRKGLRCYRNGHELHAPELELLNHTFIRTLYSDATGTLWIGTSHPGLVAYRNGQATVCAGPPGDETVIPHCLLNDRQGRLWVSVGNGKVLCRENESWRVYGEADGLPFPYITSLAEDADGTLWAGSLDVGLYRFDGTRFHAIRQMDGLSADDIVSLYADREGHLWIGTRTGGLNQLQRRELLFAGLEQGLTNDYVRGLAETHDGVLWVATSGGGLYRGSPESMAPFRADPLAFFYAHPNTVLATSDGSLWWGGGNSLLRWHEGRLANAFTNEAWVRNKTVTALLEDRTGGLWIGNSLGELVHYCDGEFTLIQQRAARGSITALALEPNGALWIGSAGGGVKRLQEGTEVTLSLTRELASQSVRTLHYDHSGTLWIGTAGGGLNCWHKGKVTTFSPAQGLATRTVSQIVEDKQGFLWLGSNRGVLKVRKQDLLDCVEGKLSFVHARSFGVHEGMLAEECSGGFSPAGLLTRSGLVCISTVKGVAFLDPAQQQDESPPPRAMLEEVVLDGHAHDAPLSATARGNEANAAPAHLTIPAGKRNLEFHYTAIHFSAPEKLGFRYKLDNADAGWIEAGGRRTAYYQRLAPGDYTFFVQVCNPDGVWGEPATAVTLTALPFFWETMWFRGTVILLAASALWWGLRRRYRARLARLQVQNAIERERLRISKDMHDHVGGMLTQVSQLTDMTLGETEDQEIVTNRLNSIGKRARDAVQSLDEIVWATNPKNDNLASFADYITRYGEEFFEHSCIRCWQELPPMLPPLPLRADVRHNVFLALREACNNVAKHSQATEVWLRLSQEHNQVCLEVEDNGCGFDIDQLPMGGNGLENMRDRLAEDGGKAIIISRPGAGTKVRFIIPTQS